MALDEKTEEAAYAAINEVAKLPWKSARERIFKNIIMVLMQHLKLKEVRLTYESTDNTKHGAGDDKKDS